MNNRCVACGEYVPEGSQICWRCQREKDDDCSVCKNRDSIKCLYCKWWRAATYESKRI